MRLPVRIVVMSGLDAGLRGSLDEGDYLVGSSYGCHLRLRDSEVDSTHLRLSVREHGLHVRDLRSCYGTWVGPLRINDALLTQSTVLTLGETTLAIELEDEPVDWSPAAPTPTQTSVDPQPFDFESLSRLPYRTARAHVLESLERAYFPRVLAQTGNIVIHAAKHAGMARESFHRMLGRIRRSKAPLVSS